MGNVCRNERGFVKFILVMIILGCSVYAGFKFGMPYYKHAAFRSDAREFARISLGDTEKTKLQVLERARELKLPIGAEDISVTLAGKSVRIETAWEETVDIFGLYEKTLHFAIDVEE